jgi:hypothetical protein
MEVLGLWRHAVKSLQGERLESARFEDDGLAGDRRWGIRDVRTGRILTARRRPELLGAAASYDGELPVITLPGGCTAVGPGPGTDGLLSRWLGSPVSLVASAGNAGGRAEYFADATDDNSQAIEWTMPAGRTPAPPPFWCSPLRHCALPHSCTPTASGIPGAFGPTC